VDVQVRDGLPGGFPDVDPDVVALRCVFRAIVITDSGRT